ncbi:MAG: PH domain-containing protein [bacterium]|nr:PH domain-containing protein [bacterium]
MYNSQNLPLSKRKIIKKTLSSWVVYPLAGSLFILLPFIFFVEYLIGDAGQKLGIDLYFYLFFVIITPSVLIFFGGWFYQYLYYKYYYYNFESEKAEISKGVISRATGHVQYSRIQNIFVDQDILDRIFGLYDVHYETAGEKSGFYSHVDGLNRENADKLVAFLNEQVTGKSLKNVQHTTKSSQKQSSKEIKNNNTKMLTRDTVSMSQKIIFLLTFERTAVTVLGLFMFLLFADESQRWQSTVLALPVVLGVPLIIAASVFIYTYIWYHNFKFTFDSEKGTISSKVIASSDTFVYYNRIQNVNVTQGVVDRLFRLYRVAIETAAERSEKRSIVIIGLQRDGADTLKNFLLEKSKHYQAV